MSEPGNKRDDERLEPTIVPVRRPRAESSAAGQGGGPSVWRMPLIGAAVVLAVAGIVAVFVYLPAWIEPSAPAPVPAAAPAEPAASEPVLSEAEIARLTEQAEGLLAELLEQQQALAARSAASWGDTTWSSYENAARLGDEAFLDEDLPEAVAQYEEALAIGETLLERSERLVAEALDAGEAALASGDAELAASQFDFVLEVDPDNARAARGRARADSLGAVLEQMRRGDALAAAGELEQAAAAYREALGLDPDYSAARSALDRVTARIARARFDRLISEGYAALDAERYDDAVERFESALAARPDSAAAQDGLAQARQGIELSAIAMAEIRGRAFERRERWNEAIERYREALATDPTLEFAREGLERAQDRADLDSKLRALIGNPRLLLTEDVLADARELLARAREVQEPGDVLVGQIAELDRLITLAATPIDITLISDNVTEVSVYRVGDLGSFATREISLKPGSYTAIGQRDGYRDVRETFTVLPGADNGPVTVVCSEPIPSRR